jgi:ubiquinone/menaquinone biosynthesis C-methylase UbiE
MNQFQSKDRNNKSYHRTNFRKRFFAWMLKKGETYNRKLYGSYKKDLFRHMQGRVVEIGPGTGVNFGYMPPGTDWHGIEPNEAFHHGLLKQATENGIKAELLAGDASHIPLPDEYADVVLCTLVLCSVNNLSEAITETKRVLKPGGKLLFIEHVAAPRHSILRRMQDVFNPINRMMADGCNCNRETWGPLEESFFKVQLAHQRIKGTLRLHSPHIIGYAIK